MAEISVEDLKACMEVKAAYPTAEYLSDAFGDRYFEYQKAVRGVQEQKPRWKNSRQPRLTTAWKRPSANCVAEYFPESSKQRVYRLVKDLQQALED